MATKKSTPKKSKKTTKSRKKSPKTKKTQKRTINPWMITSIILLLVLAGLIAYDTSKAFQTFVNDTFGIQTGPKPIGLTIVTDTYLEDPPYDVEKNMEDLSIEIDREFETTIVDINEEEGKQYIEQYALNTIPVLLFDETITETDFYTDASSFFTQSEDVYMVKLQPYSYLSIPTVNNARYKGTAPDEAPVTIIEYSSFTCPYCAKMAPVLSQALEEYPGQITHAYKHFDRGGPDALLALAAECAGDQEKFWDMHDYFMNNQSLLSEQEILDFIDTAAADIGVQNETFTTCLENNTHADKIREQKQEALDYGISGTPGIFINETFVGGAVEYEKLKTIIDTYIQ